MHLLSGSTEKYREEEDGGEDAGQDDVHDIEGMPPPHVHSEGNVAEALIGAALVEELIPLGFSAGYLPLTIEFVGVKVYLTNRTRQVHLGRVVGPGTKD